MCGIIGYCGEREACGVILNGLKRLEYRGYDSAGLAVHSQDSLKIIKKMGKVETLRKAIASPISGTLGIGHTRWASHGGINDLNAHPHTDCHGRMALVHNGIIENHSSLRHSLEEEGCCFRSETDSEILVHLIERLYEGNLEEAVRLALLRVKGTYGMLCFSLDSPGEIVGARCASPLVLGIGEGEMLIASDVTAMLTYTKQIAYLEDGEIVTLKEGRFTVSDIHHHTISKRIEAVEWESKEVGKGDFAHFMIKEICEQPSSIIRTFSGRIDKGEATAFLGGLNMSNRDLLKITRIRFVSSGTSFHAACIGASLLESISRIPATAEWASEMNSRNPVIEKDTLYIVLSQSGETADTLHAMREIQRKGGQVFGICNVVGSTIPRESDGGVYTHCGPEISVASTKAFTSQLVVLYLLTLLLARLHHMSHQEGLRFIASLEKIPSLMEEILCEKEHIRDLVKRYAKERSFFYMGRGLHHPLALEGALKLKEIAYIQAEGYSAGAMKHGPIALIQEKTPCFFLVPNDSLKGRMLSSLSEVKSRGARILAVGTRGDRETKNVADDFIGVPPIEEAFYPFLMALPVQLFAYYCACELNRDVDRPRNLAKSVTIE